MSQAERSELTAESNPSITDADGLIEDDYRLYQRADEQQDEDACSSLCLNEEEIIDVTNVYRAGVAEYRSHQLVYHNRESDLQYQGRHSLYYNSNLHQPQGSGDSNVKDAHHPSNPEGVFPQPHQSWRDRLEAPSSPSEDSITRGPKWIQPKARHVHPGGKAP